MSSLYSPSARALQDQFDTRRLADRLADVTVHDRFTPDDRRFLERLDMFFLASVDAGGQPTCSYKAPDQCPTRTGADSVATTTATAALITSYADRPTGAMLDVCADQPLPPGWQTLSDESVEDASRCPGASRDGRPTAKRIRRVR